MIRSLVQSVAALGMMTGLAYAEVPEARLQTLSRGVNVTEVFNVDNSYLQLLGDLPTIAQDGFHHIRIFVDPKWVVANNPIDINRAHLDQVVDSALKQNLGVILCMSAAGPNPWNDHANLAEVQARWTSAWQTLAKRYAPLSTDKMFFELVNEPALTDVPKWAAIQEQMRQAVRAIAPKNTVLLTSTPNSTVYGLAQLAPAPDDDAVYTFHLYQPMVFTHQGADWNGPGWDTLQGLVYPPDAANIATIRHKVAPSLLSDLEKYGRTGKYSISTEVDLGLAWARSHNAHVVVTEFGVYQPAPPVSRAAWLDEARQTIEKSGFGWTVWEWNSGFGVKPALASGCSLTSVRHALGLCH